MAISVNGGNGGLGGAAVPSGRTRRDQRHAVRGYRARAADHLHADGARDGVRSAKWMFPRSKYTKDTAQDLPVVTILKDGSTYLNEKETNINDLKAEIQRRFGAAKAVFVKADKETIWEPIAQVTAELGAAGFQVNMVTQPEDTAAKGRR